MSHGFGEDMCDLESISDMWQGNNLTVKGLLNGVTIKLYVLHVFVVDRIDGIQDGTNVVSMQGCSLNLRKVRLCEKTMNTNDLGAGNKHGAVLNLNR